LSSPKKEHASEPAITVSKVDSETRKKLSRLESEFQLSMEKKLSDLKLTDQVKPDLLGHLTQEQTLREAKVSYARVNHIKD
jgi:hypothetical protein